MTPPGSCDKKRGRPTPSRSGSKTAESEPVLQSCKTGKHYVLISARVEKDDVPCREEVLTTPELVEKVLSFLDANSTKQLAMSHCLTLQILGNAFNFNKLIKRALPVEANPTWLRYVQEDHPVLASEKSKARFLADILSMTKQFT